MELIENPNEITEHNSNTSSKSQKRRNPFKLKEEKERRQKKRARLIVRNISYKSTEETLVKHFQQWGNVEELNLLKHSDGKLVGCAFVQYESVNQATKAILRGNNKELLGRSLFVDWALGKDDYTAQQMKDEPDEKKPKLEVKEDNESQDKESENRTVDEDLSEQNGAGDCVSTDESVDEDKNDIKSKISIDSMKQEKHISNDVHEGCTVFIKNVPFDADGNDLRKVCRKYGLVQYAIINRHNVSNHSKGTAFVKFKTKESSDLCLQAGTEFTLMDQVLDPYPALSREEIRNQAETKSKDNNKDSRNLYLAREGIIMSGSKAAEGVSSSDMRKRHNLEQVKTQVLKNLNRFVSRNRLSVHNLPLQYDNEKLKQMAITYTGFHPHECRVMRENNITSEEPQGKSKGFGFLSFSTHQEALTALRKLNNNPKIFGAQHRPIVAFSIEDRAVHKIKEKRAQKSKLNNPTFKEKIEKRREKRIPKSNGNTTNRPTFSQNDNKSRLKKHVEKLKKIRTEKAKTSNLEFIELQEDFVGTAAKSGASIRMRSNKKLNEQALEHLKRVKNDKRKQKQRKIQQIHLAERKENDRPKQRRKVEKDNLAYLVTKYKRMIDSKAGEGSSSGIKNGVNRVKKPKRAKWYKE